MGSGNSEEQLRLLPKPIFEYESAAQGILTGSVFSLATGTNPSMFLIIELRTSGEHSQWVFGSARATSHAIRLKHLDKEVRSEGSAYRPGHSPPWTYMWLPRGPALQEESD